jgi:putative membrane protein
MRAVVVVMWLAGILAGVIHVLIFCMESLWWTSPNVRARFRQSPEQAEATKLFAFNQGFYNLFLGLGVFVGLAVVLTGHPVAGLTLVTWSCLSMLGAAIVLAASATQMQRGALIQGAAPLLFLLVGLVHWAVRGLAILAAVILIVARISLGRSIGFVPANRGIVSTGAYGVVRHPIYTGIFVALAGFIVRSYTPVNLALAATLILLFMIKSVVEEHVLKVDAEYADYMRRVRWRWFPGIA